jgi:hypothetical protein
LKKARCRYRTRKDSCSMTGAKHETLAPGVP